MSTVPASAAKKKEEAETALRNMIEDIENEVYFLDEKLESDQRRTRMELDAKRASMQEEPANDIEAPEGTAEQHGAAAKIQAVQRGKQARKEVAKKEGMRLDVQGALIAAGHNYLRWA